LQHAVTAAAAMLSLIVAERGLDHGLGQLLEQPVRTGKEQALLAGQPGGAPLRRGCEFEEADTGIGERSDNEPAVKESIELLAGCLWN
jgi:hypothetical protein